MQNFVYYPITQYHIILSFVLREKNKSNNNSIILDENYFTKSFINKIIKSSGWEHVYVLKKYARLQNYAYRNLFYKLRFDEIFKLKHRSFVVFTFGSDISNLLVNSVYKNNRILMGEDGIFPYYGLDIVKEYCNFLKSEPSINKFKRFVKRKINAKNEFNIQRIDKLLLLKPEWLPQEVIQQYEIEQISLEQKAIQKVFNELTCLYEYKSEKIFNDIDIIYFDSDFCITGTMEEREEYDLSCGIFKQLLGAKIYIKLKPHIDGKISAKRMGFYNALQKETACNFKMNIEDSTYPWEIVLYNNIQNFKDVSLMSPSFSTAFISPKIFFGIENNIICMRNIFAKEYKNFKYNENIKDLIGRINSSYLFKRIFTPETPDDLKKLVHYLS